MNHHKLEQENQLMFPKLISLIAVINITKNGMYPSFQSV